MTQNNVQNIPPLRTKRETDPDFVRPFAYHVRNHSINPQSREKQCCQCEETDQFHRESSLRKRRGNRFVERLRTVNGKRWIKRLHLLADLIRNRSGMETSAQKD